MDQVPVFSVDSDLLESTDPFSVPAERQKFEDKFSFVQEAVFGRVDGQELVYHEQLPLTCFDCSDGSPIYSSREFDSNDFCKQQYSFVKQLVETGVYTVTTHCCQTCVQNPKNLWRQV